MKLKLDENLGKRGREILLAAGHDVETVALQGLQKTEDPILIEHCRREGRTMVTLDLDFGNPLRFLPSRYPGIVILRLPRKPTELDLLDAVRTLAESLKLEELVGKLWIIEKGRLRVFQEETPDGD